MKKEPIVIAICNQKGGIGKSTYTTLLTSIFHFGVDKNCLCIDADYPQWSISNQRKREIAVLESNDYYKLMMVKQYQRTAKRIWPILDTTPEKAASQLLEILKKENLNYDIILIDLPGTLNSAGVVSILSLTDYVFVPMKADKIVMESTMSFAKKLKSSIVGSDKHKIRDVIMFWTMIDRRERTPLYEQYEDALRHFGLRTLKSHIPNRSKFNKELLSDGGVVGRSTVFLPDRQFAIEAGLFDFAEEILSIINAESHE